MLKHDAEDYDRRKCYSVYHKDDNIRHLGSSGSIFYAVAEFFIKQNGCVYASSMDEKLILRHTKSTDLCAIISQMKSKYIQSNTAGVYKEVIKDLKSQRKVLFVGTPCQCQALHNMTNTALRNNLFLVDFICHGVPSQHLFNMSIAHYEHMHHCKIIDFSFREKTQKKLRNYKITSLHDNKHIIETIGELYEFPFCVGYFNHIIQRNSCYKCKLRTIKRASDLTIGDFWAIETIRPNTKDFEKGYSSVIVNSLQGETLLSELNSCHIEEICHGVEFVISHNHAYTKPDKKSLMRSIFFYCLRQFGYNMCEKHFLQKHPHWLDRLLNSLVIRIDKLHKFSLT